jgi:hypothetical protein
MNVPVYQARYCGGPSDGVVVVATRLKGEDTWSMPVATRNGQFALDCRATTAFCQAIYRLIRTCHLIDRGVPTIRYEYEFVGLETAAPVASPAAATFLSFVNARLKHLLQRILWSPPPEGRPKRPGQARRPLSCPGRGFGLSSKQAKTVGV